MSFWNTIFRFFRKPTHSINSVSPINRHNDGRLTQDKLYNGNDFLEGVRCNPNVRLYKIINGRRILIS